MRTKTKPKYAIVFSNKKDEFTIVGMANLDAYSMFLIDLSKDKTIKEFYGYEYAEVKQFGWDKDIQLTLMGPAKTKKKGSKKNEKKSTYRNRLSN